MPPKARAYVKSYYGETTWMYFLLNMMIYYKHITVFGIESATVLKKDLIVNPSTTKDF